MKTSPFGPSSLLSSRLIYGCMRLVGNGSPEALAHGRAALLAAYEAGYNHFDHANIYGRGACETIHGNLLRELPELRQRTLLTTKCGIRFPNDPNPGDPGRYDFRQGHITQEVEASLRRLQTDKIDLLLLHRPDYLFHPEEVAHAFAKLHQEGKVTFFGVSNFRPAQINLLQKFLPQPLINHQLELNLHRIAPLEDGTLDQCLETGLAPSAWCPLGGVAYPAWGNTFTPDDEKRLLTELQNQALRYQTDPSLIALAWILLLPSRVAPIIGSTTPARIAHATQVLQIPYTHEDFYRLLEARNGHRVP